MAELIKGIELILHKNCGDNKGPVFQWDNLPKGRLVQLTTIERKRGITFGNHFHKGDDPSKSPEWMYLVSGSLRIYGWNKFTDEERVAIIGPGMAVVIRAHVFHKMTALTKVICIEPRITEYDRMHTDSYSAEDYETYQR